MDLSDISNDCVKPFRAFRFSVIPVLGVGTSRCFFILGAGIGLYGGIGLASKYCINCRTFLLGVGIGVLLLGAGIGRTSPPPLLLGAGIGRASPHLLGAGIGRLASSPLLGAGIGRLTSSHILTRFWSSLIVIPDNSLLTSSLRLLIQLLLYISFLTIAPIIYSNISLSLNQWVKVKVDGPQCQIPQKYGNVLVPPYTILLTLKQYLKDKKILPKNV